MTRKEKFDQAAKEAKAVGIGLILIIVFWVISGFGISRLDITVWHTPLWVITGCLGTWIFSIILVSWIVKKVFKDFALDEEDGNES